MLIVGDRPFGKAEEKDIFYKYLYKNETSRFWKKRLVGASDFPSKEAKDLIQNLLSINPLHRYSISEIMMHPWYLGEVPTPEEIKEEFENRNIIKIQKQEEEDLKIQIEGDHDPDIFKGITNRSILNFDNKKDENLVISRKVVPFDPDFNTSPHFFSTAKLEDLWYMAAKFIKSYTEDIEFA